MHSPHATTHKPLPGTDLNDVTLLHKLLVGVIIIGCALAIAQFIYNRSVWLDEAMLAINVLDRSYAGLLKPLDMRQASPVGFLLIEKLMTSVFGSGSRALRLFPLLSFLGSIVVCYRCRKVFGTRQSTAVLLVTAMLSISLSMVYFATEIKQYATEVFVSLALYYLILRRGSHSPSQLIQTALAGCAAIWLSHTAIVILCTLGLYLLITEVVTKKKFGWIPVFMLWAICFLVYYVLFIHNHPSTNIMRGYWTQSFMPWNPFSPEFKAFVVYAYQQVFEQLFGFYTFACVPFCLCIVGLISMIKKRRFHLLYLSVTPVLLHLVLSGLELYPFLSRLLLYCFPAFVIMYTMGILAFFQYLHRIRVKLPTVLLFGIVLVQAAPLMMKFPINKEDVRSSINMISQRIRPGDQVAVYYASSAVFRYYLQTEHPEWNYPVLLIEMHRDKMSEYDKYLDQLKGNTWLLFSHVYPFNQQANEETYMLNYLKNRGSTVLEEWHFKRSSCYYLHTEH